MLGEGGVEPVEDRNFVLSAVPLSLSIPLLIPPKTLRDSPPAASSRNQVTPPCLPSSHVDTPTVATFLYSHPSVLSLFYNSNRTNNYYFTSGSAARGWVLSSRHASSLGDSIETGFSFMWFQTAGRVGGGNSRITFPHFSIILSFSPFSTRAYINDVKYKSNSVGTRRCPKR